MRWTKVSPLDAKPEVLQLYLSDYAKAKDSVRVGPFTNSTAVLDTHAYLALRSGSSAVAYIHCGGVTSMPRFHFPPVVEPLGPFHFTFEFGSVRVD